MSTLHPGVIGDRELSAWQTVRGVTWVQTRIPKHAGRLSRRSDSRLVAYSVTGDYLRTFEFVHPLSWAERLIARYTADERFTYEPIESPKRSYTSPSMFLGDNSRQHPNDHAS